MKRRRRQSSDTTPTTRPTDFNIHPAAPTRLAIGHIYLRNVNGYLITASYTQLWPFARVIQRLVELHGPYKWKNPHTLSFANGITISTDATHEYDQSDIKGIPQWVLDKWSYTRQRPQHYENILERAVDVELTSAQELWDIPAPLGDLLPRLADVFPSNAEYGSKPRRDRADRPAREPRPERAPRPDTTGLTHVSALMPSHDPGQIRAALRRSGEPKPAVGWLFAEADHARIIKLIKENLR